MDFRCQTLSFSKWEKKYETVLDDIVDEVMNVVYGFKGTIVYDGSLRDELIEYVYRCSNSRFKSFPHDD
jgi:hypothetical protein